MAYTTRKFKVGDRVTMKAPGKDGRLWGYVRAITTDRGYLVYWPPIKSMGSGWDDFTVAA